MVIFNDNLVKVAEQYLKKGSTIYIEGALQTRKWADAQGVEKYSTEIVLQKFRGELTMLGGRAGGGERARTATAAAGAAVFSPPGARRVRLRARASQPIWTTTFRSDPDGFAVRDGGEPAPFLIGERPRTLPRAACRIAVLSFAGRAPEC